MAPNKKIFALKQIKLWGRDNEAAAGFVDEIELLKRFRGFSNIIQLMDAEVCSSQLACKPAIPSTCRQGFVLADQLQRDILCRYTNSGLAH